MSELLYRVIAHPAIDDGSVPLHLLRTTGDAVLWSGGKVYVRLPEAPEAVYQIEGEVPLTVADARRMIEVWKERHP